MRKLYGAVAVAAAALVLPVLAWANPSTIRMKDDCEPVSFNFVIGDGTCVGSGGTTFDSFIGQLVDHKFAGAWRFSPSQVKINAGSSLQIINQGGETHSLTPVTQFGGGGVVDELNEILFGTPNPPTFFFPPFNFVDAGQSTTIGSDLLTPGTHRFICVIHPWMEETVVVSGG